MTPSTPHPNPDPSPDWTAELARRLPWTQGRVESVEFLRRPTAKKNRVLAFSVNGERYVLKVYLHDVRYSAKVALGALSTHIVRGFNVRSGVAARVQAEVDGIEAFGRAGYHTFELVERPSRDALLFRYHAGRRLDIMIRDGLDTDSACAYVERIAGDMAARQARVLETGERFLVHPDPRLSIVLIDDEDRLIYHDFEARLNPALGPAELVVGEVQTFLGHLTHVRIDDADRLITTALNALGPEPIARWRRFRPALFARMSQRSRKRYDQLSALLASRGDETADAGGA